MKKAAFITILFIFRSFGTFAQKESFIHQPRLMQGSIRIGLVNSSLNVDYRLDPRTMASIDVGIGLVHFISNHYNKFNENYAAYDEHNDNFLNFGPSWFALYSSLQLRRIISSTSRIKSESAPFANTFTYYGAQLKYNAHEIGHSHNGNPAYALRETYQFSALLGRQVEVAANGSFLWDLYISFGGIANYKLTTVEPKIAIGVRIGFGLWKTNN